MTAASVAVALGTLEDEACLDVFRLLVGTGPQGLASREITETLGLSSAEVDAHLRELQDAAIVSAESRDGAIWYSAVYEAMTTLVSHLAERFCEGPAQARETFSLANRGLPPVDRLAGAAKPPEVEIERRVFQYGDYGPVTALRVRGGALPLSFRSLWSAAMRPSAKAIYFRAAWGETTVFSPAVALAKMTDADLIRLCERVSFRPRTPR